jgi:hypothetical protein
LAVFNDSPLSRFIQIGKSVFSEGAGSTSIDEISGIALRRLLDDGGQFPFSAEVLGTAATEEFVRRVLLPCLAANNQFHWIRKAIEIAGNRHNRRYLIEIDE